MRIEQMGPLGNTALNIRTNKDDKLIVEVSHSSGRTEVATQNVIMTNLDDVEYNADFEAIENKYTEAMKNIQHEYMTIMTKLSNELVNDLEVISIKEDM